MIIDLTHRLKNGITVYPNTISPAFEKGNTISEHGFAELTINMTTHTGTHIDAPCHVLPDTKSIDQIPLESFIGSAFLIDVTNHSKIGLNLLQSYQSQISKTEFVIFRTGWQKKWNSGAYFEDFPTLTSAASKWLVRFKLKGIGVDAISIDRINDAHLPNHHDLLQHGILVIENLTNLFQLPEPHFHFQCIPLNIEDADGAPARAFARIDK